MTIRYVAYNAEGERVSGLLEVETEQAAEAMLWQSGLTVVSLKRRYRLPPLYQLMPTFFGVRRRDVIAFTSDLSTLLHSGIALLPGMRLLLQRTTNAQFRDTLGQIMHHIEEGGRFSEACAQYPAIFPPLYRRLVSVGEETGELELMLSRLAAYMEKQQATMAKIKKALSYPAFVLVVGGVAGFVLLTYSLPAISGLFAEYGGQLPLTTRLLVGIGSISQSYGMYIFLSIVSLAVLGWLYSRTPRGARWRDRLVLRLPLVGKAVRESQMSRFASTMATLMAAGLPLDEMMELSVNTTGNTVVRDALHQVHIDLLTGHQLAPSLSQHKVFPPLFNQMIAVGEETGTLERNLGSLAAFFEGEADRTVAMMTGLIEPAIIVTVGIGVGLIAVSIISPMYGILQQIK